MLASVERAVDAYDLLWPVQRRVGGPGDDNGPRVVEIGKEVDGAKDAPRSLTRAFIPAQCLPFEKKKSFYFLAAPSQKGSVGELEAYARALLGRAEMEMAGTLELEERERRSEAGGLSGCREAVEILTRISKKGACANFFFLPTVDRLFWE